MIPQGAVDEPARVMPPPAALDVRSLSVGYGAGVVQRDLSFQVRAGEILHLAGPNGSGKSSVARSVVGALPKLSGQVSFAGVDADLEPVAARQMVGFTDGTCPFPYLTGREHLRLLQRIYRHSTTTAEAASLLLRRTAHWSAVKALDAQVRTYSHGMRQQLALLMALAHRPHVLVVDEALDGLDQETLDEAVVHLTDHVHGGNALLVVGHRHEAFAGLPIKRVLTLRVAGSATTTEGE